MSMAFKVSISIRFILLVFIIVHPCSAQIEKVKRIEIPANTQLSEEFEVIPLLDEGILTLIRQQSLFGGKDEIWSFTKLDTALQKNWETRIPINFRYKPVISFIHENNATWLFNENDTEKYQIIQLDLSTGDRVIRDLKLLSNIDIKFFKIMGSKAIIAGYHRFRPICILYSFFDETTKVLPDLYLKNTEITGLDVNEIDGYINVLTYGFKQRNCFFQIKTYNYEGKHLKTTALNDPNYSIISGQIVPLNSEESFLIGNYSIGCTSFSQGLYLSHIVDNNPEQLNYIEFSDLQNFFNYLSPKRKAKLVQRIQKRKAVGKENRFRYRLLVHNLIQNEDEIVLVAEVYYPNYRSYGATPGTINAPYYRSFDGYRYTNAIVCGFDLDGNFKWDNSFTFKDLQSRELKQMVQLTKVNDYYVLAYPHDGNIHTEVIQRDKVIVENTKHELKPKAQRHFDDGPSDLYAWYNKYFITFGKEKSEFNQRNLDVYYLTKLTYRLDTIPTPSDAPLILTE